MSGPHPDREALGGALRALADRDVAATREWETRHFDRQAKGRPIVLMGAGGLGRRVLDGLRHHGVEPIAFADNGRAGTTVEGVPVWSPADAARRYGATAAFVLTIWGAHLTHRFAHSREQLHALGCDIVLPFPLLLWKYADVLLPFYLQDLPSRVIAQRDAMLAGFEVWADDPSRAEYVAQVRWRLIADFDGLAPPVSGPQYLRDELFTWLDDEWILDGGAFDGDTIRSLAAHRGNRYAHLLAVEPDPANFHRLIDTVAALPENVRSRIDCRHVALAATQTTLHLDASGTAGSATRATGSPTTIAVPAETIDDLTAGARPTFIKLDIEGFEIDALEGARRTIGRHAPVVAVCVYHAQDHLWRIPLLLREWCPDASLFLRPHREEGWDLVCYAVPRARLARPA